MENELLQQILIKLDNIETKLSGNQDELLTPREIAEKYNIPYIKVLKILNSGKVKVNTETRPFRVLDSEFKNYYKGRRK